jgi:hypothetical protein
MVFIYHIYIPLFMLPMASQLPRLLPESQVIEFLRQYPEYEKTLTKAMWAEEFNKSNPNYYGWQWSDVATSGAKLVRLVTNEIVIINFKSNRNTIYLLANREITKTALGKFRAEQLTKNLSVDLSKIFKAEGKKGDKK